MAAVRPPGRPWRGNLPKNSTKLLRNFKEKLLPNYSKPKLIYTPTASLLPSLLWTLILCDVTKIWRNKREKKKKRKEKRHTKQLCKRRYESTGASEAGGPRRMDPVEPNTPQFFYYLVKEKWSKFPISQLIMCYLSIDIIFKGMVLGGAWCAHLCSKGFRRSWKSSCHSLLCSHRLTPKKTS